VAASFVDLVVTVDEVAPASLARKQHMYPTSQAAPVFSSPHRLGVDVLMQTLPTDSHT
jgi:hypothetical protein